MRKRRTHRRRRYDPWWPELLKIVLLALLLYADFLAFMEALAKSAW